MASPTQPPRPDRLDLAVGLTVTGLLLATVLVVLCGDQVGIQAEHYSPVGVAAGRPVIQIALNEPLDPNPAALANRLTLSPSVPGQISASKNLLVFRPSAALRANQAYHVTVHSGLTAASGRMLKQDVSWDFQVRRPGVVYLGADHNLYRATLAEGQPSPEQLTRSDLGVASFDVAADGSKIVYAEAPDKDQQTTSLYVLDLSSHTTTLLYRCDNALCANPAWRPDGGAVAFDLVGGGTIVKVSRVWVYDLGTNTAQPLLKDTQVTTALPHWSPDGIRLAAVSASENGILVHDMTSGKDTVIPTRQDEPPNFSPDGRYLAIRKLVSPKAGEQATHLVLVDLSTEPFTTRNVLPDSDPANDVEAVWRADSKALISTRRSANPKDAALGSQVFSIDAATGTATPMLTDPEHRHRALAISPLDDALLLQRVPVGKAKGSGLWWADLATGTLSPLSEDGRDARWLP